MPTRPLSFRMQRYFGTMAAEFLDPQHFAIFCTGESTIPPNLKTDALLNDFEIPLFNYCTLYIQLICYFSAILAEVLPLQLAKGRFAMFGVRRYRSGIICVGCQKCLFQPLSHNNMPAICRLVLLIAAL